MVDVPASYVSFTGQVCTFSVCFWGDPTNTFINTIYRQCVLDISFGFSMGVAPGRNLHREKNQPNGA